VELTVHAAVKDGHPIRLNVVDSVVDSAVTTTHAVLPLCPRHRSHNHCPFSPSLLRLSQILKALWL
jgi:hypothetical protein